MTIRVREAVEGDVEGIARSSQGWRESYKDFSVRGARGLSVEERMRMWQRALAEPDPRARPRERMTARSSVSAAGRSERGRALGTKAEIFAIYLLDRVKRRHRRRLMRGVFDIWQGRSVGLWG